MYASFILRFFLIKQQRYSNYSTLTISQVVCKLFFEMYSIKLTRRVMHICRKDIRCNSVAADLISAELSGPVYKKLVLFMGPRKLSTFHSDSSDIINFISVVPLYKSWMFVSHLIFNGRIEWDKRFWFKLVKNRNKNDLSSTSDSSDHSWVLSNRMASLLFRILRIPVEFCNYSLFHQIVIHKTNTQLTWNKTSLISHVKLTVGTDGLDKQIALTCSP